jgi:hypothetical protein
MDAAALLDWMTYHRLPLHLYREQETETWAIVDASTNTVLGSGESAEDALREAHTEAPI